MATASDARSECAVLTWDVLIPRIATKETSVEFCREYKLLPDTERKNCVVCHKEGSVKVVANKSDVHIPFVLFCAHCRKKTTIRKIRGLRERDSL